MAAMKVVVLTGPAGAGKNTIARSFAQKSDRCAIIDVDDVRQMLVQPHKAPWEGEEGHRQQLLGARNSIILAKNFAGDDSDVLILDVLSDETATLYKEGLKEFNPRIILLLPTYEEVKKRIGTRPKFLKDEELELVYKSQTELKVFDEKIDNTNLSPEEVVPKFDYP